MRPSLRVENRKKIWMLTLTAGLLLAVACLVFLPIPSGRAADGRDFAGFYTVSNPTDLGNGTTQVTLALAIFNYSGQDVSGATITLQDSNPGGPDYGSLTAVTIADQASADLSGQFTVSNGEYNLWQNGGQPTLRIDFTDTSGSAQRRMIEMSPSLGEE